MKFRHLLEIVHCQPWLITPAAHETIRNLLDQKLAGVDLAFEPTEQPAMTVQDGVAVIPVKGVIGKGLSAIEKSCGACGVEDIAANIAAAENDPTVGAVLFDIDSPGGSVPGVPELAETIRTMGKKSVAFTEGQMDSAAYWLASGTDCIYSTPSAEVGSIGVYMPWVDQTKRYEAAGVKVDVIKNTGGTYKGMGYPGTALTDEQRAHLQERVDGIFSMFTDAVLAKKPKVAADSMRGQTFMGKAAKKAGLVDALGSYADAFNEAKKLAVS